MKRKIQLPIQPGYYFVDIEWLKSDQDIVFTDEHIASLYYSGGGPMIEIYSPCDGLLEILVETKKVEIAEHTSIALIDDDFSNINDISIQRIKLSKETRNSHLDLKNCNLNNLPNVIGTFHWLESIDISNNNLIELPKDIMKLGLKKINLRNNNFNFPEEIHNLSAEDQIYNAINNYYLIKIRAFKRNKKATKLDLRNLNLDFIPKEIFSTNGIKILDLSNNNISYIPETISFLTSLKELILDNNNLKSIPEDILRLKGIRVLSVRNNHIRLLSPKYIINIDRNIVNQYHQGYQSNQYPQLIKNLVEKRLTIVKANILNKILITNSNMPFNSANELKEFVLNESKKSYDYDSEITSLDWEDIEDDIQASYRNYSFNDLYKSLNLEVLRIEGNDIKNLPYSVPKIKSLRELGITVRNVENIHEAILREGLESTRNLISEIEKEAKEVDYLNEAKLVLVGPGGVGKSSIARKIVNIDDDLSNLESTEGIDISHITIQDVGPNKKKGFKFNIWDFAGQKKYDASHQLFITGNSLYLLVVEAKDEIPEHEFVYWLKTISTFGAKSPIIIVLNKIDKRNDDIPFLHYSKTYSEIKSSVKVSTDKNYKNYRSTIQKLKQEIAETIKYLPDFEAALPKTWVRIRNELNQINENYIPISEYYKICRRYKLTRKNSDYLSKFLHNLGIIIHFERNPLLKDFVILNVEWAIDGIYKLLDDDEVYENFGKFNLSTLKRIFTSEKYRLRLEELINLMQSFEICFPISNQEYIFPQLLAGDVPNFQFMENDSAKFKFEYGFLPYLLMSRVIAKLHPLIKKINNPKSEKWLMWKRGVIIEEEKTIAKIVSNYGTNSIDIYISGTRKITILHKIRQVINEINQKSYPEITITEKVKCVCNKCSNNIGELYYHEWRMLEGRISNGFDSNSCGNSYQNVNIIKLMSGIVNNEILNEYTTIIQNQNIMGDNFNFKNAQVGSAGTNSKSIKNKFNQKIYSIPNNLDFKKLSNELILLKEHLLKNAKNSSDYMAISEVVKANEASEVGDGQNVIKHLKTAGTWVLNTAKEIGIEVVSELITKQIS